MSVIELTDQNFEEVVLSSDVPVVVDFWAARCAPCLRVGPVIEELAKDHNNIKVAKLNVDENPETPPAYSVSGIPTIIFFKDGKEVKRLMGAKEKAEFEAEFGLNGGSDLS